MAYTKTVFVNGRAPAYNSAEELNKVQQGIYDAHVLAESDIEWERILFAPGDNVIESLVDLSATSSNATSGTARSGTYTLGFSGGFKYKAELYCGNGSVTAYYFFKKNGVVVSPTYSQSLSYPSNNSILIEHDFTGYRLGDIFEICIYRTASDTAYRADMNNATIGINAQLN